MSAAAADRRDAQPAAAASERPGAIERLGRLVLAALLAALLVGALTFDREHRALVGDEATFAMQAESLAFDFDLHYTRADYDRFVRFWQRPPDGLILQTTDGGRTLTYGKPALYALAIAPFVRASPLRGAEVANVLFLALAAWAVTRALRPALGAATPWCVAVWIFGSVAFTYAFWEHADLFAMSATALAFALVYGARGEDAVGGRVSPENGVGAASWRDLWPYAVAGVLIAAVAATRAFYLAMLWPLWLAVPAPSRGWRRAALLLGVVVLLLASGIGRLAAGGDWSGYGGERRGFYPRTGYPEVDFPASEWPQVLVRLGNTSWMQEGAIPWNRSVRLWIWDGWYYLFGRNVGLVPYFLPILLGGLAFRPGRGRWAIPLAVALGAAGFVLVRPHNFFGGVGAIGDRYFLPLYPALWFLAARPLRPRVAFGVAALAGLFLWPLWRAPRLFPVGEDGRFSYVSPVAEAWLPYETTLSHIPGGQDVAANGLWLRFVNSGAGRDGDALWLRAGVEAEILVGSAAPLETLRVDLGPTPPAELRVGGGRLESGAPGPPGAFLISFARPSASHPMWWTNENFFLYRLRLETPRAASPDFKYPLRLSPGGGS